MVVLELEKNGIVININVTEKALKAAEQQMQSELHEDEFKGQMDAMSAWQGHGVPHKSKKRELSPEEQKQDQLEFEKQQERNPYGPTHR